ncbi:MAG TPA: hypothetical protein VF708_05335 [Pyrinomonadaceae bacterium]|jgi:hypothetical protein
MKVDAQKQSQTKKEASLHLNRLTQRTTEKQAVRSGVRHANIEVRIGVEREKHHNLRLIM